MEMLPYFLAATVAAALLAAGLDFALAYAKGNALLRLIDAKRADVLNIWIDQPEQHLIRLNVRFRHLGPYSVPLVFKAEGIRELASDLKLPFRDMRPGVEG